MKKYVIKCYRCKKRFEGTSISQMVRDYNLVKKGKYYSCDCKGVIDNFIKKTDKKKKKSFFEAEKEIENADI